MKISILLETFDPAKGYLEYYLARELVRLDNEVSVFTFQRGKHISEIDVDGFRVISIPASFEFHSYHLFSVGNANRVLKIAKEDPPEIVHSQPLFSPLSLFFMAFDGTFDYRVVGSLITGELVLSKASSRFEFNSVRLLFDKYVDRKASMIFALSDDLKELLLNYFRTTVDKICVVPLGADRNLFHFNLEARQVIRESLGFSDDDLVIIYSGKFIPAKELDLLIKALASLKSVDGSAKLLLVGDGESSYVKWLKELGKSLNIGHRIVFHPTVHRTKLPQYYSAGDIAVWPGSPSISIIEAMSTGLPVVIRRSFVSRCELEYDNGFSFRQGDLDALTAYLKKLISDPDLRVRMGERSRALVEDKLNWEKIARTYLDFYRTALQK